MNNEQKNLNQILSKIIKHMRERSKKSQEQFANNAGLSIRHYQDIEYGNRDFRIGTLGKILAGQGMNFFDFIDTFLLQEFSVNHITNIEQIFTAVGFAHASYDLNLMYTHADENGYKLCGYRPEELIGKKYMWELLENPEEAKLYVQSFFRVYIEGEYQCSPRTTPVRHKNGKIFKARGYWKYIKNEKGEIIGLDTFGLRVD